MKLPCDFSKSPSVQRLGDVALTQTTCVRGRRARVENREMPELQLSQYKKRQVVGSVREGRGGRGARRQANPAIGCPGPGK